MLNKLALTLAFLLLPITAAGENIQTMPWRSNAAGTLWYKSTGHDECLVDLRQPTARIKRVFLGLAIVDITYEPIGVGPLIDTVPEEHHGSLVSFLFHCGDPFAPEV